MDMNCWETQILPGGRRMTFSEFLVFSAPRPALIRSLRQQEEKNLGVSAHPNPGRSMRNADPKAQE
jgi:hypothetical protein